jgi:diguanylate cyclase (GGDEF)-like protein
MPRKSKKTITSYNLKRKLNIAFALMSVLPLLITGYLVSNYIFPRMGLNPQVTVTIFVSVVIAIGGFFLVKEIFDRIVSVCGEAKLIADGDLDRRLEIEQPDEIGVLGESLNQLTQRIRSNMDELKNYSEKTTQINVEIQKRVIVLSSLLQISSLISQGVKLEDILKLTIEKSRLLASSEVAFLLFRNEGEDYFLVKIADGIDAELLLNLRLGPEEDLFHAIVDKSRPFILDSNAKLKENIEKAFYEKFKVRNMLAIPVFLRGRVIALLGIGNRKDSFSYKNDDVELVDVFAKQIAIAIENDLLMHRIEKLEIKDALTGLYNATFIRTRLQEEIKRAINYQRPCAFVIIDIDNFRQFHLSTGSIQSESTLKNIAGLIKDSISEVDRVGRIGDDEFGIVLPEKNKRQALEVAEVIRKKVEFGFRNADRNKIITVSSGVSENPLDGIEAEELITKAKDLVAFAKKQGKNRVVAFKEPPVCQ